MFKRCTAGPMAVNASPAIWGGGGYVLPLELVHV